MTLEKDQSSVFLLKDFVPSVNVDCCYIFSYYQFQMYVVQSCFLDNQWIHNLKSGYL